MKIKSVAVCYTAVSISFFAMMLFSSKKKVSNLNKCLKKKGRESSKDGLLSYDAGNVTGKPVVIKSYSVRFILIKNKFSLSVTLLVAFMAFVKNTNKFVTRTPLTH